MRHMKWIRAAVIAAAAIAIAAFFVEWGVYDLLAARIHALDVLQMFTVVPFEEVLWIVLGAYFATGFLVGTLGSMMSIRKFLDV